MSLTEQFGDWSIVIDFVQLKEILKKLNTLYSITKCSPEKADVFKAFKVCRRKDCKVIFIGQDPYPQEGVATGLLFGNNKNQKIISPSLNIIKNCILDLENPYKMRIFDPTLESIAKQGVLLLNSSLTVEVGKPNSHQLIWRPFIENFLRNLSEYETGIIYVLFGNVAHSFIPYIGKYNHIIKCPHPAYCARNNIKLPDIFTDVNSILLKQYGSTIRWYTDI